MPDIYETDTTRTFGRETPHVSDAPQISPAMPGGEVAASAWRSRLSWAAILAGVVIALLTQLFLNLIGMAFGAASFASLLASGESATPVPTGAGIWFAISTILAGLAGGYAAARFAGAQNESNGGWHGLTTWGLTALVLTYLVGSFAAGLLGGAAKTTATTAAQAALVQVADPFSSIEQQLQSATAGNDPAALREAAISSLRSALTGSELQAAEARERAAQAIAKAENISIENARTQVQNYEQQYRRAVDSAKQQARQTANEAAAAVSRASWLGALSLLLGGLAGWLGGRSAAGSQPLRERLASATGRPRR
jgi:hypothetical protein